MLTGEPLALFLDKDALKWGEEWRDTIDASLASVAFFIPVLTPRYFMSAECRRELQFFARKATSLGIKELILPLLYVDVPALQDATTMDDLATLVRTFQWEDWRELRFAEPTAETYRRRVASLAERIVEANRQMERADTAAIAVQSERALGAAADDSPGFLDQMATAEETMPKLTQTIGAIGQEIQVIGQLAEEAASEIRRADKQAPGFGARLLITRKLAQRLTEPIERVWSSSNEYASQLHDVDDGFRVIIERGTEEAKRDPDSRKVVCELFKAIRLMNANAHSGLASIQALSSAVAPAEKMSRDLRPMLRRLREALTRMLEASEVMDEWVRLIDGSGVECENGAVKES
jgi:DNA repair ATPase RecN